MSLTASAEHKLRSLINFPALVGFLRDDLDWPLEADNIEELDDLTYVYSNAELGIKKQYAAKITRLRQIRNLVPDQPWGIFYVEFDTRHLPVGALRRILNAFVEKKRAQDVERPVWQTSDLLFICVLGQAGRRGVAFAHFRKADAKNAPELRTFSWDSGETHFYYLRRFNLERLRWPQDEDDHETWRQRWRSAFDTRHREVIQKSDKLASAMAEHAAMIRELILDRYKVEDNEDPLHVLYERFREILLHDLTPNTFADMVAQTITYGLFSAAEQTDNLTYASMVEMIPPTNPFLKQLLQTLIDEANLDLSELGVGPLVNMLREVDVARITRDFGRTSNAGREDPVIHFYEDFLKEYDKEQRVERGVFYTPDAVVSYIVRSVDHLLKTEFGIADGLASAERDPDSGEHRVQILDPATGTGTFLAHIIDQIATAKKANNTPAWNRYVHEDLLPRLNGFELMMAPYTIAHMKLGLKLRQTGYQFESDERLRVFLTNALEKAVKLQETLGLTGFLSQESNAAASVKRTRPILVVTGNPPYSYESSNDEEWIRNLVQDYYQVDGKPLGEKNPKGLQDDYVKFIRFSEWRIARSGEGILAFITNHGYLDNPTFKGMRQHLLKTFDKIYLLDLNGNIRKGLRLPDGTIDENVFDIVSGVVIGIFIKDGTNQHISKVYRADLTGKRSDKYNFLDRNRIDKVEWRAITPTSPRYLFSHLETEAQAEYDAGYSLPLTFPVNSVGIYSARDSLAVQFTINEITKVVTDFQALPEETARQKYQLGKDSRDWKVRLAQKDLQKAQASKTHVKEVSYRPFDIRYTYYTGKSRGFICMPRPEVMNHMVRKGNLGICFMRRSREGGVNNYLAVRDLVDKTILSSSDNAYVAPLYAYSRDRLLLDDSPWKLSKEGRRPNLDPAFVQEMVNKLNLSFVTDGRGDLFSTFGPEDIFHYAYAIFHSPNYRERYAEFLKIDFPRLPLTGDVALFRKLAHLGADLVALHLLEDDYVAASWNRDGEDNPLTDTGVTFVAGSNGTTVGKMSKSTAYKEGRVYIDTSKRKDGSYFAGVPANVWTFQVGGYQVCHKWLYDRRASGKSVGRTLTQDDIAHYKRIVAALRATIALMESIDTTIDNHGGWPLVGSQPDVEPEIEITLPTKKKTEDSAMSETADFTTEEIDRTFDQLVGIEHEDTDVGEERDIHPFDPTLIRVDTRSFTIDLLMRRISDKAINLHPDFQRMGGIWSDMAQSRLIESLMIRIPLPAFYMDASDDEKWLVIDGLQRLTALRSFILDKTLRLRNLEFWTQYNGKTFDELPRSLQRRIEESQVTLYLVQRGTPHNVKFNIFKRINTTGMPLSGQEIRHALNLGESTKLLQELANTDAFLQATDSSVSPKRMTDRELVLRFLSFIIRDPSTYTSRDELDPFLNDRMQEINAMDEAQLDQLRDRFKRAMVAAYDIFGNLAFRKQYRGVSRRSPISKALFEVWAVNLDKLSDAEIAKLIKRREALNERFVDLMEVPEFFNAITTSTGDPKRIQTRFGEIGRIIQETLNA